MKSRADRTPDRPEPVERSYSDQVGSLDQLGPVGVTPPDVRFDAVRAVRRSLDRAGRKPTTDRDDLVDAAELLRALGLVPDPRSYDDLPVCPTCSARAGSPCRDFSRKSLDIPHPQRAKAFAEMYEKPTKEEVGDNV